MARVTAADVARDIGIRYIVVTRVLSAWNGYGVPDEIRERVRVRAAEMGYEPVVSNLRRFTDPDAPKDSPRLFPHPGVRIY